MPITLTKDQIESINFFIKPSKDNDFKPNYHGMYDYIYREFKGKDDVMPKAQQYWFEQAAQINEYLNAVAIPESQRTQAQQDIVKNPSQAAYFIQQINIESLTIAKQTNPEVPDRHNQARQ